MSQLSHSLGRLYQAVRKADRILLVAHKKPDGDALGSSSAFLNWCLREGKNVTMFCADLPSPTFKYLNHIHRYTDDPTVFDRPYDIVIVFDSGDLKYAGVDELVPNLPEGYTLINIDHHRTNQGYGDINIVEFMSSASEIVYHFFKENDIVIDEGIATSLLTGLCWDTTNFSNPLTSDAALEVASELVKSGGRFNDILRYVWHNKSYDALKLWGTLLSRLYYNKEYDVASTYFMSDDLEGMPGEITEGMVNFLSGVVREADTIMLLKDQGNGRVKGSFRGTERDVSKVAKLMGGGGHRGAAGFAVQGRLEVEDDGRLKIVSENLTVYPDLITN